jgi:type I restriction enzyme S subunit
MKDEATTALVPKLRFPEFRGTEGWKEKPLKAAAEINPANGGLPESFVYIDLESVDAGELKAKDRISRVGAPSRAQRVVERGDIIYQVVRPYQRNNLLCEFDHDENYVASTGYAQLRANGNNRFLYQSIHTDSFVGRVIAKCTGSNYPAINSSDLAEIHLPIPPTLAEQQKIADCLSSVEELIAAQAREVEALKTHKKALMQQLFPREGETEPRPRFPQFQDAGDWEEKKLDDLAKRGSGHTPNKRKSEYYNGGIKWVSLADSKRLDSGLISQTESEISHEGIMNSSAVLHPAGTVLLSRDAGVGKSAVMDSPMAVSQHFIVWTCDSNRLSNWFLYYVLQGLKPVFERVATGSTIKTIGLPFFKELTIVVPAPEEQHRIASILSNLDALITAETSKREALKTHKKGLMQQLFPSQEEPRS